MLVVPVVGVVVSSPSGMQSVLVIRLMIVLMMVVVMHTDTPHADCAAG